MDDLQLPKVKPLLGSNVVPFELAHMQYQE
jgi:hypothetical protein